MRSSSSRFGVAVIGLQPRGWHWLEQLSLRDDVQVGGAWDADATLRTRACEQGWVSPEDCDALLARPEIQGVAIAVELPDRAAVVRRCLELGKHVLAEPPLAPTAEAACELYALAAARGSCCWAASPRRWDADALSAASAVQSGRLGDLRAIRYTSAEWAPWASSVIPSEEPRSTLELLGPHVLDQLGQLTTAAVAHVWLKPLPAEDGFLAVLTLADGVIVQLDVRRRSLAGVVTGWLLEGERSGYRNGRTYTPTLDGEIVDEVVKFEPPSGDAVLKEWLRRCRTVSGDASERSHGEWVARLYELLALASAEI